MQKTWINYLTSCVLLFMLLLTGCANIESGNQESLVMVDEIIISSDSQQVLEGDSATNTLKEYGIIVDTYDIETGYRLVVYIPDNSKEICRVRVVTDDSGAFYYRNVKYSIDVHFANGIAWFMLPGESKDYKIQLYAYTNSSEEQKNTFSIN